ncbi:MAG: flippase-like domain-containing protein [Thermomicrobiales bacterium]|jgi:phosphatidylglycerol lysyltransferase|nr:flippase-like domain-containing protein [Thermomicrobiales bacterium]
MNGWFRSIPSRYQALSPDERLRVQRIIIVGWLLLLAILAVWLLRNQREQLRDIWTILLSADRTWLAVAAIAEIGAMVSVAWTFNITLKRLGHKVSTLYLTNLHLQRAGVNFAAPFGGPLTGYVFLDRLARRDVPAEDSFLTLAIRTASVWGATVVVLVITAGLTGRPLLIAGSIALLIAAIGATYVVAKQGQGDWKTILRWSRRLPARHAERVEDAVERFKSHNLTPTDLISTIGTTLITRTGTIALIYACVMALGFEPTLYTVFMAYVVSFVAGRLVPFMYGMGAVEGSLTVALTQGGVPGEVAIGATLLFRFYDFLLPSIIGLIIYTWDERHRITGGEPG